MMFNEDKTKEMKFKRTLLIVLIIIVTLLLPLIFNKNEHVSFDAPDLSEIEYSEVFFINETNNLKLAGMLMVPEGEGPFPTVVIIQGSGPSFRNNGWYLSVLKHLQDNGIAAIIPDKRGCEKSEGEWIGANFEELATDALSTIEFVKTQNSFKYSYIGLVGMSQGGWIAPIAATKTNDVSFIANISGATISTDEQLLYEEINNISAYTYPFIAKLIAPMTSDRIKKMEHFSSLVGFDPIPYWKEVNIPVFLAFGEDDKNVPVSACIDRLKENHLNNYKIKTYPKGGHGIINIESKTMNKAYLNDLVTFIKEIKN